MKEFDQLKLLFAIGQHFYGTMLECTKWKPVTWFTIDFLGESGQLTDLRSSLALCADYLNRLVLSIFTIYVHSTVPHTGTVVQMIIL